MPKPIFLAAVVAAIVFFLIAIATFGQCNGYYAAVWMGLTFAMIGIAAASIGAFPVAGGAGLLGLLLIAFGLTATWAAGCQFAWPAPL